MHNLRVGTRAIDIADITINQRERLGMGEPRDGERPEPSQFPALAATGRRPANKEGSRTPFSSALHAPSQSSPLSHTVNRTTRELGQIQSNDSISDIWFLLSFGLADLVA